jgi:1-deoxy-D-xylulose-5-phosphate reductoisomerase
LERKLRFDQIHAVNIACLSQFNPSAPSSLGDLLALDLEARSMALAWVGKLAA